MSLLLLLQCPQRTTVPIICPLKKSKMNWDLFPAYDRRCCKDLVDAFKSGTLPGAMTDDKYFNIKVMKKVILK